MNLYAITYAPHATEDVFMRESAVVAKTLADRFDAGQRTVQLVVHPDTATTFPWATPHNLRHTLAQMARVMDRERDVLKLLVKGYSYKMIADELFISIDTVRSHIKKIYEKMHVNSKSEAVALAFRNNIM